MRFPFLASLACASALSVSAITIEINYDYDSTGFFTTYTDAAAALEQAAADIGAVINSSLGAISEGQSGQLDATSGSSNAYFDWSLTFTNPSTGATETLTTFSQSADTITIYVGARSLSGSTLGQGGPGGASISVGSSGAIENEWVDAVAAAESLSNSIFLRGGQAPILGNFSGNAPTIGSTTPTYSVSYTTIIGNLWFDNDFDNDGFADDSSTLNNNWHFDHTTDVAFGKFDFYSVALHEVLHAIGFGVSDSWDDLVSGTDWLGSTVIDLYGSGTNLIDGGGAHVEAGIEGLTLIDGTTQEVVMDPNIGAGVRKTLTNLDVAFLQDMGFSTSAVPEPAEYAAGFGLLALGFAAWRRRRAQRA
jgi:MYXO-CTERM domain-containing protein